MSILNSSNVKKQNKFYDVVASKVREKYIASGDTRLIIL